MVHDSVDRFSYCVLTLKRRTQYPSTQAIPKPTNVALLVVERESDEALLTRGTELDCPRPVSLVDRTSGENADRRDVFCSLSLFLQACAVNRLRSVSSVPS